jgi:hypothetical protein
MSFIPYARDLPPMVGPLGKLLRKVKTNSGKPGIHRYQPSALFQQMTVRGKLTCSVVSPAPLSFVMLPCTPRGLLWGHVGE